MENKSGLAEEARDQIEEMGKADILVGIPSFNNERTIGYVVRGVQYGLAKYFPKFRSVVMNSDGGSTDRTREIVKETSIYTDLDTILIKHPVQPARSFSTPYHGIPGKGSAFKSIFEAAELLKVRACVVVDSDVRSINSEWIELLIDKFRKGLTENRDYWLSFLPPERIRQLEEIAKLPMDGFNLSQRLWVETVYDFAVAYRQSKAAQAVGPIMYPLG